MACLMSETRSYPRVAGFAAAKWPWSLEASLSVLSEGLACVVVSFLGVTVRTPGTVSIVGRGDRGYWSSGQGRDSPVSLRTPPAGPVLDEGEASRVGTWAFEVSRFRKEGRSC